MNLLKLKSSYVSPLLKSLRQLPFHSEKKPNPSNGLQGSKSWSTLHPHLALTVSPIPFSVTLRLPHYPFLSSTNATQNSFLAVFSAFNIILQSTPTTPNQMVRCLASLISAVLFPNIIFSETLKHHSIKIVTPTLGCTLFYITSFFLPPSTPHTHYCMFPPCKQDSRFCFLQCDLYRIWNSTCHGI